MQLLYRYAEVAALAAADADAELARGREARVNDPPPRLAPLDLPPDMPLAQVLQAGLHTLRCMQSTHSWKAPGFFQPLKTFDVGK
jgi:hypothetical protein